MFLKTFIALLFLIRIRKVSANLPDLIFDYSDLVNRYFATNSKRLSFQSILYSNVRVSGCCVFKSSLILSMIPKLDSEQTPFQGVETILLI